MPAPVSRRRSAARLGVLRHGSAALAGAAVGCAPRVPRLGVGGHGPGTALQDLVGRLAIDRLVVLALERACGDRLLALLRRHVPIRERGGPTLTRSTMPARRRLQGRDQRLADAQLGDHVGRLEGRVGAEGVGGGAHALLLRGRVGAQRVLDPVAELAQHRRRHVRRVLGDEIDADALGADQPHHLLDLLDQRLGRVVEQQVRLVEEEHQLRLVEVAHLRQLLEQLATSATAGTSRRAVATGSACRPPAR